MDGNNMKRVLVVMALTLAATACSSGLPDKDTMSSSDGGAGKGAKDDERAGSAGSQDGEAGHAAAAGGGGNSGTSSAGRGGSSANADTSGSAGSGGAKAGSGGSGGGETSASSDCEEVNTNETRDTATPFTEGKAVSTCLSSPTDVDFYEFTAPADVAGGYYVGSLSDVRKGRPAVEGYAASDNEKIFHAYNADFGASVYFYWAAAPGQKYRLEVHTSSTAADVTEYTLQVDYTKVVDSHEPNDTRDDAKALTLGTTLEGLFFAGLESGSVPAASYQDWFSFEANAGMVTIKVDDVATNVRPSIQLQNPTGGALGSKYNNTAGGSINYSMMLTTSGTHRLNVGVYSTQPDAASQATAAGQVPDSFTRPYKLTVTQP